MFVFNAVPKLDKCLVSFCQLQYRMERHRDDFFSLYSISLKSCQTVSVKCSKRPTALDRAVPVILPQNESLITRRCQSHCEHANTGS